MAKPAARISIEDRASSEAVESVRAAFAAVGLPADVQASYMRRSAGELPPITYVEIGLGIFLGAFLKQVGTDAGRDAYQALKRFFVALGKKRGRGEPTGVDLQDEILELELVLPADLPDEAYQKLFELDLELFDHRELIQWDTDARGWRPFMPNRPWEGRSKGGS